MINPPSDPRSQLPSVDKILQQLNSLPESEQYSHEHKVEAIRKSLQIARTHLSGEAIPTAEELSRQAELLLIFQQQKGLQRVINGSGIILHTGLGRAVLPREAVEAVAKLNGYCSLQIDLATGERGRRDGVIEELLQTITGAEAATVVNNNAAATLLVLSALCKDSEVIVSRGQLIEIGGSFRLPDVIAQSGARLVEVGTTNKTHLRDYANAITPETRVLMRVNPSNYRIVGFTQQVSIAEMAELKKGRDLVLVDDLGCGALIDLSQYGLPQEPTVQASLRAGADVALFSGDKLISGPQSGIIVGKQEYITQIRKHPLARALRVGKFTVAALEATLKLFLHPEQIREKIPTLRMITLPFSDLQKRACDLAKRLSLYIACEVIPGESACGGGSLPDTALKTALVAMRHPHHPAAELARKLRCCIPPIITRIQTDTVLIDVRTLREGDEDYIVAALKTLYEPKIV